MSFTLPDFAGILQDLANLITAGVNHLIDAFTSIVGQQVDNLLGGVRAILDGLFAALLAGAQAVISLFPEADPLGLAPQDGIMLGYSWLNSFLPVSETLAAIATIVIVAVGIFAMRALILAKEQIPFN